jgi:hypothetical protein
MLPATPPMPAEQFIVEARAPLSTVCSAECWQRQHERRQRGWARRHPWRHRWNGLPGGDRAWVRSTAQCESGNDPRTNTGNGFYGLLQFTLPTARAAGFKVRPDLAGWYEQGVRGARWMHVAGTGQWPVCG